MLTSSSSIQAGTSRGAPAAGRSTASRRGPGPVQAPLCVLDLVLVLLREQVCPGSPPGVWVCSTDAILHLPQDLVLSWEGFSGVRVLALPGDVAYAADHGVYLSDAQVSPRCVFVWFTSTRGDSL
ncbi:hypothetical protein CgunFtcFv8_012477 [Champsocephalus gunnari]|uniref:GDP-fucose pyrophosphorylase domain-containing protein n=1 Tax=Champsocephalus gunnari TaxID=52237 RepID=A0AAN8HTS9_CHAGU|nr:hypothetical protein CgunFtcFv8_012477 [Champsocephalus gunnari]